MYVFLSRNFSQSELPMPPVRLWLIGILFIINAVFLRLPRFPLPFFSGYFGPSTLTTNDILDGLVFVLLSCFLHRSNFPRGISAGVFLCFCLKLIGSGAHVVANSLDNIHEHDLRDALGKQIFWFHEYFAHSCQGFGEYGLLAFYIYHYAPVAYVDLDLGLEMPGFIIAGLHGITAGVLAVGTKSVHTLLPLYVVVAGIMIGRKRTLRSSILIYFYLFCALSLFFIVAWGMMHDFSLPTFDTIDKVYKV